MKEYIERKLIYNKIAELESLARDRYLETPITSPAHTGYMAQMNERTRLKHLIADTPAADVVERVRGEWIQTTEPLGWHEIDCVECSACGETWVTEDGFDLEDFRTWQNFCPNCGADMRGEENVENEKN